MTRPCPDHDLELELDNEWDLEWDLELDNNKGSHEVTHLYHRHPHHMLGCQTPARNYRHLKLMVKAVKHLR